MKRLFFIALLAFIACQGLQAQTSRNMELMIGPGRFNSNVYGSGKIPPITLKLSKKIKKGLLSDFEVYSGGYITYSKYSYDYLSYSTNIKTFSVGAYGNINFTNLLFDDEDRSFDLIASIYGGYTFNIFEDNALITALSNRINTGISLGGHYRLGSFYAVAEVGYMPQSLINIGLRVNL